MIPTPWLQSTRRIAVVAGMLLACGCTNSLNRAIYREKPEAVDEFLKKGANVNEVDGHGATPLIYAAQHGDLALMKKLVARGAKIDVIDKKGCSALSYLVSGATYKNDAVAYLLAQGAKLNVVNNEGHTPLALATMRRCKQADADFQLALLKMLVDAGSDPNFRPTGKMPLHLAAFAGQPASSLDYLLHASKEPRALTDTGYSAFTEAARGDQHDAAVYLAGQGFVPQILPVGVPEAGAPPILDPVFPISARALAAYGDYENARGNLNPALDNYQRSATNYRVAGEAYRRVIAYNSGLLKTEKGIRRGKWISAMALTVVGTGLATATGVGFVVVPKRGDNRIDEFADELERQQTELSVLTKEETALQQQIESVRARIKATTADVSSEAPKS